MSDAGTSPPAEEAGAGYEGAAVAGAVLATIFFPFISLVAALLLQGGKSGSKEESATPHLGLGLGWLAAVGPRAPPHRLRRLRGLELQRREPLRACQGGPELNSTGRNIPGTDKYVFPCVFGGTETTRLPSP